MITLLSPDIYKISEFIDNIKKEHIEDASEDTLAMGIYGYMGDLFANQLQNTITVASEWGNEGIPIKAKFERSILAYAYIAKIKNINATPSKMEILLGIPENELLYNMKNDTLVVDNLIPIYIGGFEFHLDYDIIIKKTTIGGDNVYIAQYDIARSNILSDIQNPYISPPAKMSVDNVNIIFIQCTIRQINISNTYNKIISDDSIENKSFEFTYESQLASFDVFIKRPGQPTLELIPLFEGMPMYDETLKYCYYSYIDSQTIRIKFIKESFEPKLNDQIEVRIKMTEGAKGVFEYNQNVIVEPISENHSYQNMTFIVTPTSNASGGIDRKSIDDLRKIIPKEMLSRGTITCNADLVNFFNLLDDKNNRIKFLKKTDNQFERSYYSYILLKDEMSNVIPSNTINLKLNESDFDSTFNDRLVLKPGAALDLNIIKDVAVRFNQPLSQQTVIEKEILGFLYTSPFMMVVNKSPLSVSYYLNIVDKRYNLNFSYINMNSILQFIGNRLHLSRKLLSDRDTYNLTINFTQNISEDRGLIVRDESGAIIQKKIKCIALFKSSEGNYIRYKELDLVSEDNFNYRFILKLDTDDTIGDDSTIKIKQLNDLLSESKSDCYLPINKCEISLYVLADVGVEYGREELDKYVDGLQGYTVCNRYDIKEGVDFLINYTDIISSKAIVTKDTPSDTNYYYKIMSAPVLRYSYAQSETRVKYFIDYIIRNRYYIYDALNILEDGFKIDFKFFNTYGPSKVFTIGDDQQPLDRTNISLSFRIKVDTSADENIKQILINEIKKYMENLNDMSDIHISRLITYLQNKYQSIVYIVFHGINAYGADKQILERYEPASFYVPEFLNINSNSIEYSPAILIDMV